MLKARMWLAAAIAICCTPTAAAADGYYDCVTQLAIPWMGRDDAMYGHMERYCADLDRERFERRANERQHWEWRR